MKKITTPLLSVITLASCASSTEEILTTINKKYSTDTERAIQYGSHKNQFTSKEGEEPVIQKEDKTAYRVVDTPKTPSKKVEQPSTVEDSSLPPINIEAEESTSTFPNALYDVNETCDWIHPNLRPIDELGREVPIFETYPQVSLLFHFFIQFLNNLICF